jgi:uncharacterized phage protein (TIGR01671 family)
MRNRTLKFRAWDDTKLNWIDVKEFSYTDLFEDEKYIVQQFTGLKDVNGKDIYEGDIVEFEIPLHNEKFEPPLRNKKHIAVIKFCNCAFTVVAKSEDHWFSIKFLHEIHDDICNLKLIVIDNIFERDKPWERFENSQLLKNNS